MKAEVKSINLQIVWLWICGLSGVSVVIPIVFFLAMGLFSDILDVFLLTFVLFHIAAIPIAWVLNKELFSGVVVQDWFLAVYLGMGKLYWFALIILHLGSIVVVAAVAFWILTSWMSFVGNVVYLLCLLFGGPVVRFVIHILYESLLECFHKRVKLNSLE